MNKQSIEEVHKMKESASDKGLTGIDNAIKTLDNLSDILFEVKILGRVLKMKKESQLSNYQRTGNVNGVYAEEIEKTKNEILELESKYKEIFYKFNGVESIVDSLNFALWR